MLYLMIEILVQKYHILIALFLTKSHSFNVLLNVKILVIHLNQNILYKIVKAYQI